MDLHPNLGRAAAAALILAAAPGAALAHPHADGDGKKIERIVIVRDGKGAGHRTHAGDRRVRRFELHRGGARVDCAGGEKIVDENAGDGDKKTKVIICSKGGDSARTAEHLERALARISANDDLSDEQKAKIETALRAAIDRARNAR